MALSRWTKHQLLSIALRSILLSSLLILKTAAPAQGQGGDSRVNTNTSKADCACLEQVNSTSNENNCTLPMAGLPENLEYGFREIATQPRHAELTLSWSRPENYSSLCYYELRIRGTSGELGCQITEDVVFPIHKESTNLTLTTTTLLDANSTLSLLYECRYQLTISSLPGNENITENVYIRHSRSKLSIDCFATYNPESVKYDIFTNWSINDPLAVEAASVNGYRVKLREYPSGFTSIIVKETKDNRYRFRNQMVLTKSDTSPGIYLVEVEVKCLSGKFGTPFFWRMSLLPHRCNEDDQCEVLAPPQPPSPLDSVQVDQAMYFLNEDTLRLVISWRRPMYPNGILRHYQLRIGTVPILSREDSQESGITILTRTAIGVTETSFSRDIIFENKNSSEIYIQMRSVNNYSLYSNWSSPVVINLSDITIMITAPPVPPPQPPEQFPTYAYALIGVSLLTLLAILIVTTYLSISYVKKHCCIDMGPEVMPMGNMFGRTATDHGSTFAHINYSRVRVDEWEIPETEITVFKDQPLGEGCFGKVYKGLLMGHSLQNRPKGNFRAPIFSLTCPVAIKQLKTDALGSEKENFFKEMKMMKMVSTADNEMKKFVVNMVGCVTVKEPLLLVVEYVRHGDLQAFLRTIKKQTILRVLKQQSDAAPYLEPQGVYSELNPGSERYADLGALEEKNLLEFARQIAAGMEFLSGLGVIHRDLACRNILIGEQKNLKISDFGMSRYLPKDEVYVPMSHGLLPLRWMAIESIHAREFTTASDVWSYGIVLWELCTMCHFPYKSITNHDILGFLRQGYRMPKPSNCSTEVYDIMLRCWCEEQQDRPSFPELRSLFDQFLTAYVQDHYPYIELQSSNTYERLVPETGQLSDEFDHFFNGSGSSGSVHYLRTAGVLEDQVSVGIGSASPSKGGFLSSEHNGGMSHLSPLPQHNTNRLSMLSDSSVQLLRLSSSNQELHSNSSSMNQLDIIGRQGIQSLPTESGAGGSFRSLNESEFVDLRYVESPVVGLSHSSTTMTSDMSLDRPEVRFSQLKATNSFPDCSQGNDRCSDANNDGEVRSSSFSVQQKNVSTKKM